MTHRSGEPVKCDGECGRRTRNPYWIAGGLYCVDCAEERNPKMVRSRVGRDYANWNNNRGVYPYKTRTD